MNEQIDYIIDRRSLRKKLSIWRLATIFAMLVAIAAIGFASFDEGNIYEDHIARIKIEGTIFHDPELLELIDEVKENENVKAVIFVIDSPGGTTVGGESLYNAILELAEQKPTVASINTLGASAAYLIASASEHIVAHQNSIVGSIGVIFQYPQIDKMLEDLGIKVREIKSSPLKAAPSIFTAENPQANEMIKNMIDDSFQWFKNEVGEQRGISGVELEKIADGSVFTGRQALAVNLIDSLGGEAKAVAWLESNRDIEKSLDIITHEPYSGEPFGYFAVNSVVKRLGIKSWIERNIVLDGLVSIWQK